VSAIAHAPSPVASAPPPAETSKKRNWTPYLLLAPGMLWLTVFFVVPMIYLASQSLQTGSLETGYKLTWEFSNYTEALSNYSTQVLRSLLYAATATVLGLLVGYPLAYAIAFKSGKWKNILLVLVIAPFFTSFLIRTLAWQTILSDDGIVATVLRNTGITNVLSALNLTHGDQLLNTPLAVVTGLTYNFLPFMVLPLYASLERIDLRLLEAGNDLYATPFTAFRKITWPLSLPGVVAGTLLTFIPASGDYINSRLLGNVQTTMVGSNIDSLFLRVLDYPTAAALSFSLMLIILVLVGLYVRKAGTEELV
jgi:spermidine/putrescine transport system permease protein